MDRFERDPKSGTQQTRDDSGVGVGNPASSQGQFEQRQGKFMLASLFFVALHCHLVLIRTS
jgi:hypothetical protein